MNIGTAAAAGDHDDMMESFDADQREIIWNDLIDQVRRALRLMNADVSAEYSEAVATVPTLVSRESRFVDFLRTEDYHALRAARRLALFWKTRKDFFGEDRWLLPMTQVRQRPCRIYYIFSIPAILPYFSDSPSSLLTLTIFKNH